MMGKPQNKQRYKSREKTMKDIEIAGRYAELLNRKHYGGDNINNKTLKTLKMKQENLEENLT